MLEIITGPMKSSKSKYLINLYNTLNKEKTIVFTSSKTRSQLNNKFYISSRDKNIINIDAYGIDNLEEIINFIKDKDYNNILIDEFQFFNNVNIITLLKKNYNIFIFGLIQTYDQKPFGLIKDLFHITDNIIQLKSICEICNNNNAINNIRKKNDINNDVNSISISICSTCLNTYEQ
jgi:thymidine kinase